MNVSVVRSDYLGSVTDYYASLGFDARVRANACKYNLLMILKNWFISILSVNLALLSLSLNGVICQKN